MTWSRAPSRPILAWLLVVAAVLGFAPFGEGSATARLSLALFGFADDVYERLPPVEAFRHEWEALEGQAVAVSRASDLDDPPSQVMPGRVIYQNSNKTALARR